MMTPDILRERVRERLDATCNKPVPMAARLGKSRDYLTDLLNGSKNSISSDALAALARETETPLEYFLDPNAQLNGDQVRVTSIQAARRFIRESVIARPRPPETLHKPQPIGRSIPVVGEAGAGLWKEAHVRMAYEIEEHIHLDVQGYERSHLTALKVVGPSMNLYYPPGRFVIVAPAAEAGIREGDHVVVERARDDLVEITIKELASEDGRVALWPRSTDPAFQEPVYLSGNDEDQTAPRIVGVVVADYSKRQRPAQVFDPPRPAL